MLTGYGYYAVSVPYREENNNQQAYADQYRGYTGALNAGQEATAECYCRENEKDVKHYPPNP
jgi:hypothetical protein